MKPLPVNSADLTRDERERLHAIMSGWAEELRQRIEVATKAQVPRSALTAMAWRYAQTKLFGRVTGRLEAA